ncbi:MAG: HAD family hydrolase [Oscillospiraceae bacterium]|nr:HAD family hydrolase [Oscillospiraceae bacterium]
MCIKAVLFDLDGTLLPMDQDVFVKTYFKGVAAKLAPHGYEPKALIDAIWAGTMQMIKNDGSCTNEDAFWKCFASIYGEKALADIVLFERFYEENFDAVQTVCGYDPQAAETVEAFKKAGLCVALATNPIFPAIATEKRIRWAGLKPEDFAFYTTYENSKYCKPNLRYYEALLKKLDVAPGECLMVGNDVGDDMVAAELGMQVFLLTDCLINKTDKAVSDFPNGSFGELREFAERLM